MNMKYFSFLIAIFSLFNLSGQSLNCIDFDYRTVKINKNNNTISYKGKQLFWFKNFDEAKGIVDILRANKINQYCYLGNIKNPDFSLIKSNDKIPSSQNNSNRDCIKYRKELKLKKRNNTFIIGGESSALSFDNYNSAKKALSIIKNNNLNIQCFCNRPKAALSFWLTDIPNQKPSSDNKWGEFILGYGKKAHKLHYENINGTLIHEGDIIVGKNGRIEPPLPPKKTKIYNKERELRAKYAPQSKTSRAKVSAGNAGMFTTAMAAASSSGTANSKDANYNTYLWPFGLVPYTISDNIYTNDKNTILNAIKELNEKTALNIYPRKNNERDYIELKFDEDLIGAGSSRIGRQSGKQFIKLKRGVSKSTVIHEFLHAVGILHEQSRGDRGMHVNYYEENVSPPKAVRNFKKRNGDEWVALTPYDFESIMHYSGCAFSKNKEECNKTGKFATLTKKDGSKISRSRKLSSLDIQGINSLYKVEVKGKPKRPAPSNKYREIKLTLDKVSLVNGSNGIFDFTENFTCKMVIGKRSGWKYTSVPKPKYFTEYKSLYGIKTEVPKWNHKKDYKDPRTTNHGKSWKWNVSVILPPGERYAQAYFRMKEYNKIFKDKLVDSNPHQGLKGLYLIFDTYTNEIFLTDNAKNKTICVGFIGYKLDQIQGYDGLSAGFVVDTEIKVIPKEQIKVAK